MQIHRTGIIFILAITVFTLSSCSKGTSPTVPDEPWRTCDEFEGPWLRWQDWSIAYNETDISPLVYGPDNDSGDRGDPAVIEWDGEDRTWAVEITIKHDPLAGDSIQYAWMDNIDSPTNGNPIVSGMIWPSMGDYDIKAAKVATCYFYDDVVEDDWIIRVTVACMIKPTLGLYDWEIAVFSTQWTQGHFPDEGHTAIEFPIWLDRDGTDGDLDADDYSPDLAYDNETGTLHVVWTSPRTSSPYFMLAYARSVYATENWAPADQRHYPVYEELAQHQMFHPRIDIGDPYGAGDVVAVVYNAFSAVEDPCPGYFHIGISEWDLDEEDFPGGASYDHKAISATQHCAMPRIDIAPKSNDPAVSVVFTNSPSEDVYQVYEWNSEREAPGLILLEKGAVDEGVYGTPAIHYGEDAVSVTYFVGEGAPYTLWSTRFDLVDTEMSAEWGQLTGTFYGDFFPLPPDSAPGVETAIIDEAADNSMWAVWCNEIDASAYCVLTDYGDST